MLNNSCAAVINQNKKWFVQWILQLNIIINNSHYNNNNSNNFNYNIELNIIKVKVTTVTLLSKILSWTLP